MLLEEKLPVEAISQFLKRSSDWLKSEFHGSIEGGEEIESHAFSKIYYCKTEGGGLSEEYVKYLHDKFLDMAENIALQYLEQKTCLMGDMVRSQSRYNSKKGSRIKAESSAIETNLKRIVDASYGGISQYYEGDKFVGIFDDIQTAVSAAKDLQKCFTEELQALFKMAVVDKGEVILASGMPLKEVGLAMIKAARVLDAGKKLTDNELEGKIFVDKRAHDELLKIRFSEHKDFLYRSEKDLGKDKGKIKIWELKWKE